MPMNIQTEAELVQALAKGLKDNFKTDVAVQEFAGGYGIADLVFAKNFIQSNNKLGRIPIDNYYALKSYLKIPYKTSFSIADVMEISGTSKSNSLKIINSLIGANYIYRKNKFYYKYEIAFHNPVKHLVAIEAKLKDWKQGILQARRYKSFTDECYLAILSRYEKNIDYKYLNKFEIGLILYQEKSGEIFIKKRAKSNFVLPFYEELNNLFAKELFLRQATQLGFQ
jgi:hypothetical protein